jgi:hypothetical protein
MIQEAIRKKYAEVSRSVVGKFRYLTGKAGAAALGYHLSVLSDLPDGVFQAFCGVETHSPSDHFAPEKPFSTWAAVPDST